MDFPLSSQLVNRLDYVASTGSTNSDLIAVAGEREDLSVLVASYQSAGRGRSTGRQWIAPEGSSLAISVLLRPTSGSRSSALSASALPPTSFGWLPLLAGLAMSRAVGQFIPANDVAVKWPNDVLVNEHKISGILSELLPDLSGVVIGAGINIRQNQDELPIETATSLALERARNGETAEPSNDKILAAYLGELRALYSRFVDAGGDATASGIRDEIAERCGSIGRRVRAIMPGDQEITGNGVGLDETGRLLIQPDGARELFAVSAGDIVHLRHN
ncbi:MAG: biotin--[acetyl-CoA-carboxylase] ligase [Rhodoluna sp.]|nr:biotin--[acetyl-CoA-carboxylase] ligase [Rhodoluna sp.]